jgi:hypothetical protein
MDTVETNFFPTSLLDPTASTDLTPGLWMTMYHESDPKYAILGIDKNRCFINTGAHSNKADNINCGNLGGGAVYPPAAFATGGVPIAGTGLTASENGLALAHTYEYTKILPDGQFTPGTEIQYFYRKSFIGDPVTTFEITPDTNYIFPRTPRRSATSTSTAGARFASFGSLEGQRVGHRGQGMACISCSIWASGAVTSESGYVADSMGMTSREARRPYGWRASDQNWAGVNVGSDDSICRRDNGGQSERIWMPTRRSLASRTFRVARAAAVPTGTLRVEVSRH